MERMRSNQGQEGSDGKGKVVVGGGVEENDGAHALRIPYSLSISAPEHPLFSFSAPARIIKIIGIRGANPPPAAGEKKDEERDGKAMGEAPP